MTPRRYAIPAALALISGLSCTSSDSTSGSGSCPCTVGNSGIHVTLGCGQSGCVTLNGTVTGYRCEQDGTHEDPSACTTSDASTGSDTGSGGDTGSGSDTGAGNDSPTTCTPKTCAELGYGCGNAPNNGCGQEIACPACPGTQTCSDKLTKTAKNAAAYPYACLNPAEKIVVYGDLQGGVFGIEVDQDLPNLVIGLVANDVMHVTISGAYVDNIVAVYFVGNETTVDVTGVPASKVVAARLPDSTIDAGFAQNYIDCEDGSTGACNPPDQVNAFFEATFPGATVVFNKCAMKFTGTMKLSEGGTCP